MTSRSHKLASLRNTSERQRKATKGHDPLKDTIDINIDNNQTTFLGDKGVLTRPSANRMKGSLDADALSEGRFLVVPWPFAPPLRHSVGSLCATLKRLGADTGQLTCTDRAVESLSIGDDRPLTVNRYPLSGKMSITRSLAVLSLIGLVDSISYMAVAPSLIFYVLQVG
jgi:hypothetical protein